MGIYCFRFAEPPISVSFKGALTGMAVGLMVWAVSNQSFIVYVKSCKQLRKARQCLSPRGKKTLIT
jgi:hypothetical protein